MERLKERVRVEDRLDVEGGVSSTKRGIWMPDGSPVDVETIAQQFGVSQEKANEIAGRLKERSS